jgi:hypothetical protein
MAKYKDRCGYETVATDSALLIHNSDYSNKEIIYADANGLLTYTTDNANETLSILMREEYEVNGIKPIHLTTFIDQPITNMGNHYQYTDSMGGCQCQSFDVKVNVPSRINDIGSGIISGKVSDANIDNNSGYTNFADVLACKDLTGAWPLISTVISYSNPEQAFAALIPDIGVTSETDADLEGTVININTNGAEATTQVSTVIDGKYSLRNYAFNSFDNVYGFDAGSVDFYSVSAYQFESLYDLPNVDDAYFFTVSSENDSSLNRTFDLILPEIDHLVFFDILMSDSGEYDLSYIPNMDYFSVGIQATYDYQTVLSWELIAPMSGKVPSIENIDLSAFISKEVLDASVDTIEMNISVQGYDGIDGYQDFMNSKLEITSEISGLGKWSNYDSMLFEVTSNNFSGVSSPTVQTVNKAPKTFQKREKNKLAINAFDKFMSKKIR